MNAKVDRDKLINRILSIDKNNYYDILDADLTTSKTQIKSNYKKLIIRLHPDKNINTYKKDKDKDKDKISNNNKNKNNEETDDKAKEAFLMVSKAYQILNNDKFRDIYNKFGKDPLIVFKREELLQQMKLNPKKIMLNKHLIFHSLDLNGDILNVLLNNMSAKDTNEFTNNFDDNDKNFNKSNINYQKQIPKFVVYQNVPIIINNKKVTDKQKFKDFCTVLLPLLIIFLVPIIEIYIFD